MLLGSSIHGDIPRLKDSEVMLQGGHLDDSRCVPRSIGWVLPRVANGLPYDVILVFLERIAGPWFGIPMIECGFTVAGRLHTSLLEPKALCNFPGGTGNAYISCFCRIYSVFGYIWGVLWQCQYGTHK